MYYKRMNMKKHILATLLSQKISQPDHSVTTILIHANAIAVRNMSLSEHTEKNQDMSFDYVG